MLESDFQAKLIQGTEKNVSRMYRYKKTTRIIFKGFPDLTILYNNKWATLGM